MPIKYQREKPKKKTKTKTKKKTWAKKTIGVFCCCLFEKKNISKINIVIYLIRIK